MKLELLPRTDVAVRALRYLNEGGRRTSMEIAAAIGSTPRFIPHVMGPLVAAGWVKSTRGPGGGYSIDPTAGKASMLQLIETVEGPTDDQQCVLRGTPCPARELCSLHDAWTAARGALTRELALIPVIQEAQA